MPPVLKASLGYRVRPSLKTTATTKSAMGPQPVKALAVKFNHVSLILETHMLEGERELTPQADL